jgi:hypothetical protein
LVDVGATLRYNTLLHTARNKAEEQEVEQIERVL